MTYPLNPHPFIKELEPYLNPHSLLADVGSYIGSNGLYLVDNGHTVANVDLEHQVLKSGLTSVKELGALATRCFFIQGDAKQLMFRDATFDAVISMHMLQQLPNEEASIALSELQRITKPGGYNAVKVYAGTPHEIAVRQKYTIFSFGQLRQKYESLGWQVLRYDERHDKPNSDQEGISSYSKLIARKPTIADVRRQDLLREAEYYRRSDTEYFELLLEQAASL